MAVVPGATLFLQAVQDIRVGGRASNAQYQYTLQGDVAGRAERVGAEDRGRAAARAPNLADVNTDQQNKGLESDLVIDRDAAARLGITVSQIDNTLYDAFGQRQVSTIYVARNQYHVIMEVAPRYWQNPETLKDIYVSTSGGSVGGSQSTNAVAGTVVASGEIERGKRRQCAGRAQSRHQLDRRRPARAPPRPAPRSATSAGDHDPALGRRALTAGRDAARGQSPGPARRHHHLVQPAAGRLAERRRSPPSNATMNRLGVPATIRGTFQGTAKVFQDSLDNQPFLILAALVAIYIVLGVLYESYIHPLTILSTLPSAGVGALLALMAFKTEF